MIRPHPLVLLVPTLTTLALAAGAVRGAPLDSVGPGQECPVRTAMPLGTGFFTDVSDASGIRLGNFVPSPATPIPINDHSRLAFVDLNGDGRDDIVAHSLFPNPQKGIPFEHLVFLNNGDGTFRDFSDDSGLRDVQAGFFAFGDVDNDGDQDAFAGLDIPLADYTHRMLLNDGDGRFVTKASSGVEGSAGNTVAGNAVFADFNGDANLDLYIGNGQTSYVAPDELFLGRGDGTFANATVYLKPVISRPSNGAVACDYDNDGDLDVFVSTYGVSQQLGANVLWENDGFGRFANVAVARGFASQATGNYFLAETGYGRDPEPGKGPGQYVGSNGFGLQCEDITNDGLMDVFLTAISHPVASDYSRMWSDPSQLLVNQGPDAGHAFVNAWLDRGLPFNEGDVDGAAVDFDNDGYVDLSISRDRKYEASFPNPDQKSWFGLMHQRPDGSFESVGVDSGINDPEAKLYRMKGAQNHAWSDIDADGDLDLLVGGRDQGGGRPNFLFRNELGSQNDWLAIRLEGDGLRVNRDAIGARVSLVFADRTLMREVRSTRGMYNGSDTRVLHFGLAGLDCGFVARVRWPDGKTVEIPGAELGRNRYVTLRYTDALPTALPPATATSRHTATPTKTPRPVIPTDLPTATPGRLYLPKAEGGRW